MVSKRATSAGEPDLSPRAVASPNQTFVPFASIPAGEYTRGRSRDGGSGGGRSLAPRPSSLAPAVQQEWDRRTRSLLARAIQPACTYRPTGLSQRPGTSVRTISCHAGRLSSAGTLPADGSVHRTSRSDAAGAGQTQRLMDTSSSAVPVASVVALAVGLLCDRCVVAVRSPAAQQPKSSPLSFDPRPATRDPFLAVRSPAAQQPTSWPWLLLNSEPRTPNPEPRTLNPEP